MTRAAGPAGPVASVVPLGRTATVAAPATSANLGPGFDAFGLALDWTDSCSVSVAEGASTVTVTGQSAGRMPTDSRHLVIRTVLRGLSALGAALAPATGLRLTAHNTIPHGRGLGSSSAAIVSGLGLAWGLARPGVEPDLGWLVDLATEIEGHPDNVAAAAYGGFVIAYGTAGSAFRLQVVRIEVHPDLAAVAYVPQQPVSTHAARQLLPATVPHRDAAANAGRAALAVLAVTGRPDLLVPATRDWLHTDYRRTAMPESYDLLTRLRADDRAAVISGAGPTVLVLGSADVLAGLPDVPAFVRHPLAVGTAGLRVRPTS